MVEHIVLFKMKSESTQLRKKSCCESSAAQGKIGGMVSLSAGESFTNRHRGYTIGLVVRFVDREALERYGPHPEHVPVKAYVDQVCEDVIGVDYEF